MNKQHKDFFLQQVNKETLLVLIVLTNWMWDEQKYLNIFAEKQEKNILYV